MRIHMERGTKGRRGRKSRGGGLRNRKAVIAWLAVLIWMGVIFYFSHQPGDVSGETSGRIVEMISGAVTTVLPFVDIPEEGLHFVIRKGAHFSVYAVLGLLSFNAFLQSGVRGKKALFFAWLLATAYAGVDEYHQTFIPGRSGEVTDVMIDSAGANTGIMGALLVRRRRR